MALVKCHKHYKTFTTVESTIFFSDMKKGADTRTLSAEIFDNCGNFLIVEDYALLLSEENLFLVKIFYETFNIGMFKAYK